jgi:hypothetical protein
MNDPSRFPVDRAPRPVCGAESARTQVRCNLPQGHIGEHVFYRRHLDGSVRERWSA